MGVERRGGGLSTELLQPFAALEVLAAELVPGSSMDFTSQRIGVPTLHDPLSDRGDPDPRIEPRFVPGTPTCSRNGVTQ